LVQHLAALEEQPLLERVHLSHGEFARRFGASLEDVAAVRRFARNHGLHVVAVYRGRRTVELSGTVAKISRAFGVRLSLHQSPRGVFRARSGEIRIPRHLVGVIVAVLGLDTRPSARAHFRVGKLLGEQASSLGGPAGTFSPPDLAGLYQFPAGATGAGQCVGIIELGGGFRPREVRRYLTQLGITPAQVIAVGVDGGSNAPTGDPNSADGEVLLDIEIAGALAPGAKIVVYFAPNTDRGFADAILAAVHDESNKPSVISISWGSPEDRWTGGARLSMTRAFQAATALGITVLAASGDNGSSDGLADGRAHVDFPASSPYVVGCGGTSLKEAGGRIASETVWSNPGGGASGGGVSALSPVPGYQQAINPVSKNPGSKPGRGVPDVSGNADPATGYRILVDGQSIVVGGTSAVAPLWTGLLAIIQEKVGKSVAPLLPALYRSASSFQDISQGSNGAYSAARGWDPCTGLGSPNGTAILEALSPVTPPASAPPATSPAVAPSREAAVPPQ
jgi:kumamolisin